MGALEDDGSPDFDPLKAWEKEMQEAAEEDSPDPFSPEIAPGLTLVVNLRIYDVLMAILKENNPDAAREILELHSNGGLAGTMPDFTGFFMTDALNEDEDQ